MATKYLFLEIERERLIGVEARCMWWIDEKLMHCNRGAPKILKTPYISCYFMYILSLTPLKFSKFYVYVTYAPF